MPELKDKYANLFQLGLTESAANTLTYNEINLGLTIFQKKALLISRVVIDWTAATYDLVLSGSDTVIVGITQSDQPTAIALADASTIFKTQLFRKEFGTAASGVIDDLVRVYDLTDVPGGGELIVPSPLFGAIQSASLATPATVTMRIYFQIVDLKPDEYFELLEARRFFG